jgi:DnaK suppressor protein
MVIRNRVDSRAFMEPWPQLYVVDPTEPRNLGSTRISPKIRRFQPLRARVPMSIFRATSGGARRLMTAAVGRIIKSKIVLDESYRPSDDEAFMNERQREYFRRKLLDWKDEILREARETIVALQSENENHPDLADRASSETDRAIELRARDRQRKLIAKIDSALARIDDGTYGYCEETGEPISLRRLEARPIATLSLEAQERHERNERVYRDD